MQEVSGTVYFNKASATIALCHYYLLHIITYVGFQMLTQTMQFCIKCTDFGPFLSSWKYPQKTCNFQSNSLFCCCGCNTEKSVKCVCYVCLLYGLLFVCVCVCVCVCVRAWVSICIWLLLVFAQNGLCGDVCCCLYAHSFSSSWWFVSLLRT